MKFDFSSSSFILGETEISVKDICERSGRDYQRTVARAGFEKVYRSAKSEMDFFTSFLHDKLNVEPGDTILLVNQSGGYSIPGLAPRVFAQLSGVDSVNIIEISDGCTGFLRALILADSLLKSGSTPAVTIVCAEKYSKFINDSLSSAPIFSDAVSLVRLVAGVGLNVKAHRVINSFKDFESISVDHTRGDSSLRMDGAGVLRWATLSSRKIAIDLSSSTGTEMSDIERWFVHQGSRVVVDAVASSLGITGANLFSAGALGNTVSCSIPISMILSREPGPDTKSIGLLAFGVGLSMVGVVLGGDT